MTITSLGHGTKHESVVYTVFEHNLEVSRMIRLGQIRSGVTSIALIVAAAALLAMPAASLAAQPKIVFGVDMDLALRLGDNCVMGYAPPASSLDLVWKSASGTVKARTTLATQVTSGYWNFCSDTGATLVEGDVLKATVGTTTRKFAMPLVTATVDRVNDFFYGSAPAGTDVYFYYDRSGCCSDFSEDGQATADADGYWQFVPEDGDALDGYWIELWWTSAKGDTAGAYSNAPSVSVTVDRSAVFGAAQAHQTVRLVLRDGTTGARKAVATAVADEWGDYSTVFRNGAGASVPVAIGDRVVGLSLASDLHWHVFDIAATADVAANFVSGMCGNRAAPDVDIYRRGEIVGSSFHIYAEVDEQGNFLVDFNGQGSIGFNPANIKHADRVEVTCPLKTGDFIRYVFRVP